MMAILCCCSHLRTKESNLRSTLQNGSQPGLPIRPASARLSPPDPHHAPSSPQSTIDRSSLTNPLAGAVADSLIQLGELVVEESDDEHGDDGLAQDVKNRSTSTLQAVKAAIRRHLSQDSLARQSESEEQIARRAEVKRLMRQRIQEELRSETSEIVSGSSTPHRLRTGSVHLPGNGPRDTIEFTVDSTQRDKEPAGLEASCLAASIESDHRRRMSCLSKKSSAGSFQENQPPTRPVGLQNSSRTHHTKTTSIPGTLYHLRRRSSVPEIPLSPHPESARIPSLYDSSSLASWRLSLSADKLAELFAPDKSLSLFRPIASSSDTCSASHIQGWKSVKHMRSVSSPLVISDLEPATRVHSRQASFHSDFDTQLPAPQSLIKGESPVGLWLRTQSQDFRLSTASQGAHDSEDEMVERASSRLTAIPCPGYSVVKDQDTEVASILDSQDGLCLHKTPERCSTLIGRKALPGQCSRGHSMPFVTKSSPSGPENINRHGPPSLGPDSLSTGASASPSMASESPIPLRNPSVKENRWIGLNMLQLSYFQRG